jgi:Major Facilitator Superfamily
MRARSRGMVETAQATSGSGRLTAIRQFIQQACLVINGPAAGYLASIAFGWTAAACGAIMFLLVPITILFLRERRQGLDSREVLGNAKRQLVNIATARTMWAAAGLMALFYIAPGFAAALFYKQQNELHLSTQTQGLLGLIAGICGILAAVGYGILCRRLNLRTLLIWCMLIATIANLGYLFYSSLGRAQAIEGLNGFGYTLAELALMDLAVRSTPAGSEGLGFSIMVSVRNLALFGTDWFGSNLLDQYHLSFNSLVIANSATTLIAVPLVLLLPSHRHPEGRREPHYNQEAVTAYIAFRVEYYRYASRSANVRARPRAGRWPLGAGAQVAALGAQPGDLALSAITAWAEKGLTNLRASKCEIC